MFVFDVEKIKCAVDPCCFVCLAEVDEILTMILVRFWGLVVGLLRLTFASSGFTLIHGAPVVNPAFLEECQYIGVRA